MTQDFRYVPLNSWAIASVIIGMLCALSLAIEEFALLGFAGALCGFIAIGQTWQYEQRGRSLARLGVSLSVVLSLSGLGLELFQIGTEVAEFRAESLPGYRRVDFQAASKPKESRTAGETETLADYEGQRICLKGYAPYSNGDRVIRGVLTLTVDGEAGAYVLVPLKADQEMLWTEKGLAVSGTLTLIPEAERVPGGPTYMLVNPTIRIARCYIQLPERHWSWGKC